jgi:hypothetical protein
VHDLIAQEIVRELKASNANLEVIKYLLEQIRNNLFHNFSRVLGGVMYQVGDAMSLVPIQPGQTPKFLVAPTFSGAPFTTVGAQAAVTSSDPANFPVALDLTDDPTGLTFEAAIPSTATPPAGGEPITVTWTYTNTDGTVATVTGTVTENGITDDVTGGTFTQVA